MRFAVKYIHQWLIDELIFSLFLSHLFDWFASPWWRSLGRSWPRFLGLLAVLHLSSGWGFGLGCAGSFRLRPLALLLAALQAHVHLVFFLHLAHLGQVEADAVAMEPVVAAAAANHEPRQSAGSVILRACSNTPKSFF